jgi:hypothetical protein
MHVDTGTLDFDLHRCGSEGWHTVDAIEATKEFTKRKISIGIVKDAA